MGRRSFLQRILVLEPPEPAEEGTPARALSISLLALLVAVTAAVFRPESLQEAWGFVWLLSLVPSFLFSYYRGLQGATLALALGMVAITVAELAGGMLLRRHIDWWLYGAACSVLIIVSLGAGFTTELLRRGGGDPHAADRHRRAGRELARGLERDELVLFYQPIVELESRRVRAAEALVRWRHPESGLLAPEPLLATAAATGLAEDVARWVLRRACSDLSRAREQLGGTEGFVVAVNLTPEQCREPVALLETVEAVAEAAGIPPARLQFEISESQVAESREAARQLMEIGASVIVDDFGTERASLGSLRRLEVDGIKIDRSFVASLTEEGRAGTILRSVVELSHRLGLTVTGEGVERHEQLEALRDLGCDLAQGFLLGEPRILDDGGSSRPPA